MYRTKQVLDTGIDSSFRSDGMRAGPIALDPGLRRDDNMGARSLAIVSRDDNLGVRSRAAACREVEAEWYPEPGLRPNGDAGAQGSARWS